jgi:membrane fusion protein (multidrug efflux system)
MKTVRLACSLALLLVQLIVTSGCKGPKETPAAPLPVLRVGTVEQRDVPLTREFVGRTIGSIDATVRTRVQGVLTEILFQEGREVSEGQLLYKIDAAPFEAKVAAAKGQLAEAQTRLVQTDADLARIKPLAAIDAVSKRELDKAVAAKGVAEGAVAAAQAQLDAAKIELGYTQITSPVSGTIGISQAKVGEVVGGAGRTIVLNTVSKLDPIHVQFAVTEKEYLYFARLAQESGQGQKRYSLEMILADGSVHPNRGEVVKIDRGVDANSGAIAVEASFPNPTKLLRPGLFAKIRTVAEVKTGAIVVPKEAVKELQGTFQVFVIDGSGKVEQRDVQIGAVSGDLYVIESGLQAGETIAVEGIQRLRSGMMIEAKRI